MSKEAVIFLFIAIIAEVVATTALKLSDSFTRLLPAIVTVVGYGITFWCLTIPMRTIPTGVIYAIWSGVGIVLIGLVGWIFLGQKLDLPAMLGMGLIIAGVIVINLFSRSVGHYFTLPGRQRPAILSRKTMRYHPGDCVLMSLPL